MSEKLILIVGRTGTGKSVIADYLAERLGVKQVKSYTTRPPRKGENIKSDHIFIAPSDVRKYKDDIAAYTKIGEYEYFTTWDMLKDCGLYVIDPVGVRDLREAMATHNKHIDTQILYVLVNKNVRMSRIAERGDMPQNVKNRMEAEERQFAKFEESVLLGFPEITLIDNSLDFENTKKQLNRLFPVK